MTQTGSWTAFTVTLLLAFILTAAPFPFDEPQWIGYLRPDWILLGWFFWLCFDQSKCSLGLALLVGILIDAILFDPLGLNVIILLTVTYITRFTLRLIEPSVGLRSAIALLVLCFLVTTAKSFVLLITLEVTMELNRMLLLPLVTVVWWFLLIPFLYADNAQFGRHNQ